MKDKWLVASGALFIVFSIVLLFITPFVNWLQFGIHALCCFAVIIIGALGIITGCKDE